VCHCTSSKSAVPRIPLGVGPHLVNPASTVRDLGIYIVANLSGRSGVWKSSAALRQLCDSISYVGACRLPLTNHSSCHWCLVGNATLSGLVACLRRRLQSVFNAAARSIYNPRWSDHVTPALMELHRLRAVDRVECCYTLVFRCLHDLRRIPVVIATSRCGHGLLTPALVIS